MAVRTQSYEWLNVGSQVGHCSTASEWATTQALSPNTTYDIFTGSVGNSITMPPSTKSTQFVVLENLSVSPINGARLQVKVNTTAYFENPDGTSDDGSQQMAGISGISAPYPCGNQPIPVISGGIQTDNYATTLPAYDLYPSIYILPGQKWTIDFSVETSVVAGVQTASDSPSAKSATIGAFVQYTLFDGPDALLANKILEMGIPVTRDNINWMKRKIISQTMGDE